MIKKLVIMIVMLSCCAALFCGCAIAEASKNKENLNLLQVGMTEDDVRNVMGEPVAGETYCSPRVWYYYTDPQWFDGYITRDECTPVVFDEDGKVEGWGHHYLKQNYTFGNWSQKAIDDMLQ